LGLTGPTVTAKEKDKTPASVTVAFGTGLNNAVPGAAGLPNHHVLPQEIKIRITRGKRIDGTPKVVPATVNFVVSGFHFIYVYQPGVKLQDVVDNVPATGTFINYERNSLGEPILFAKGVNPGNPPHFADRNENPSGVQNRTDSIAFDKPGRYLVICNVRGHFLDGMYAWVRVVDDDDDDN
jgi:hypothetical protein